MDSAKDETRKLLDSFKAKYGSQTEQAESIDSIMGKYRKPQIAFETEYDKIKRKYLIEQPVPEPASPSPELVLSSRESPPKQEVNVDRSDTFSDI